MAVPQAQEQQVNFLLASGTLSVEGSFTWKQSNEKSWYKVMIPVKCTATKPVAIRIVISVSYLDREQRNFVLLWNNNIRVRALCIKGNHGNKHTNDEEWIRRMHKHRWTDACHDRFAYTPTDITETTIQGILTQFCAECGIVCHATIAELSTQGFAFDDL